MVTKHILTFWPQSLGSFHSDNRPRQKCTVQFWHRALLTRQHLSRVLFCVSYLQIPVHNVVLVEILQRTNNISATANNLQWWEISSIRHVKSNTNLHCLQNVFDAICGIFLAVISSRHNSAKVLGQCFFGRLLRSIRIPIRLSSRPSAAWAVLRACTGVACPINLCSKWHVSIGHGPVDPCPIDTCQSGTAVDPCPIDTCQSGTVLSRAPLTGPVPERHGKPSRGYQQANGARLYPCLKNRL